MAKQTIKKPSKIDKENKKDTKKTSKKEVKKIAKKEVIKQAAVKVKVKKKTVKPTLKNEPVRKKTASQDLEPADQSIYPIIKTSKKNPFQAKLENIKADKEENESRELMPEIIRQSKEDREKNILTWAGVVIFMVIIVVIWIYNIQIMLQAPKRIDRGDLDNFNGAREDFTDNMKEVRQELQKIREKLKEETERSINAGNISTTSEIFSTSTGAADAGTTTAPIPTEINELKSVLENKAKTQDFPQ